MKSTIICIFITILVCNIIAQNNSFIIQGKVIDKHSNPIPDVKIFTKSKNKIYRTNINGVFKLNFNYTNDRYVVFSHIGYTNDTLFFNDKKLKKKKRLFNVELKEIIFDEVVISTKKIDTVFGSSTLSIQDYILLEQDKILMLAYNKSLKKDGRLILTNKNQDIISEYTIPYKSVFLYKDYSNKPFLVSKNNVFEILINNQIIKLTPFKKQKFYSFNKRVLDTIKDNFYYSNFSDNYPAVDFFVVNKYDSIHNKILSIKDDFMLELYRAQYKYVSGRDKLWAYRKELETGIDKEIWIGATHFTKNILYKPIYAPLFIKNDTIIVFDQYKNLIFRIDSDNYIIDSSYFNLKIKGNQKWKKPILEDEINEDLYALYNKGGYYYLKKIDLYNNKVVSSIKLSHRYINNITIRKGFVYYIYRPFESLQKKFLYREKIN